MTADLALAEKISETLKTLWRTDDPAEMRAGIMTLVTLPHDAASYVMVCTGIAYAAARNIKAAHGPHECTDPNCEGFYFVQVQMPESPQLQAIRTVVALANDDTAMAGALIAPYANPDDGARQLIFALVDISIRSGRHS